MRTLLKLGAGMLLVFCPAAPASSINVLSQTHHVTGVASAYDLNSGQSLQNRYDRADAAPVSGSTSITNPYNGATSSAQSWTANFFVRQQNSGNDDSHTSASASAECRYTFAPLVSLLSLNVAGELYGVGSQPVRLTFSDLTTGLSLESRTWDCSLSWLTMIAWQGQYAVNLSHQYQLVLSANGHSWDYGASYSTASLTIVPEPGAVALVGVAGLLVRRHRH